MSNTDLVKSALRSKEAERIIDRIAERLWHHDTPLSPNIVSWNNGPAGKTRYLRLAARVFDDMCKNPQCYFPMFNVSNPVEQDLDLENAPWHVVEKFLIDRFDVIGRVIPGDRYVGQSYPYVSDPNPHVFVWTKSTNHQSRKIVEPIGSAGPDAAIRRLAMRVQKENIR